MKKVGIAFILLAAVVGTSYLNAVRNEAKSKHQFQEGYARGAEEAQVATHRADSFKTVAAAYQASYADSLRSLQTAAQTEKDSLARLLTQKDQQITALKERGKTATRTQAAARKSETSTTNLRHAQILDFYRKKLSGLPKDLSETERKLAVSEIREETAKKFSVSMDEVDKIRQGARLAD